MILSFDRKDHTKMHHICGLRYNDVTKSYESSLNLRTVTCNETWTRMFQISEHTPRTKMYIDSMAAVFAERRRHADTEKSWIIHPFSSWRFLWDLIMTITYLISFLTIPYMICFVVMNHDNIGQDQINLLIYMLCWIDIAFNFITGYYDAKNKRVELQPQKIIRHYFKTFLILDIVSSLPWDRITHPWRRLPGDDSNFPVILINLLPCLKLLRYNYVNLEIYELFTHFEALYFYYEMFSIFMLGFFILYWSACICYLLPTLVLHFNNTSPQDCDACWITGIEYGSPSFRFQYAVFIVVEYLTGSGYASYMPKTSGYLVLSCSLMAIGRFLECYIAVTLLQIKSGRLASESKFQELMNQLLAYTRQKQLPKHMKIRLQAYYYYRFRGSYFREKVILANLSEQLKQEIALQSSHRLVENVAIFKSLPKHILRSIVKNLKFELFLPNDVIIKAGAHGDCMFFLSAGTVAVLTPTGKEICHLDDGAHFGEVALLVPDQRRVASVIAIEVCELYRLDRKDFRKCIAVHTELFARIERIATERIERAVVIEEQHKRYLMRSSTQANRSRFDKYY